MIRTIAFLVLMGFISLASAADIGLSPPRLDLTARPGETVTETIIVLSDAPETQQLQVEQGDWSMGPSGSLIVLPAGSVEVSAADWIVPEASEFEIGARSSREFRVSVTVPEDAALDGTYHAIVFFTVVPPPTETAGIGVVTTTRIGLTVYVTVAGSEENGSELVDLFQAEDRVVTAAVANLGNTLMRLGGYLELRDENGVAQHRVEVPDVPVLRGSEREVAMTLPETVAPGYYVLLALIEDSRGGLLVGELPIEVP